MLKKEEIKHIANLARISLKEEEISQFQRDISQILDYFAKLQEIDTQKIESIGHISGIENVFRPDSIRECDAAVCERILENAPEIKDKCFKVKSVL